MSLAKYLRSIYRDQNTIPVEAPWEPEPGVVFRLWVRPDSDSDWCAARAAAEVDEPRNLEERTSAELERRQIETRKLTARLTATKGQSHAGEQKALLKRIEEQEANRVALPDYPTLVAEGWDVRYPIYTAAEVDRAAEAVGRHLVERIETCQRRSGELVVVREWDQEEIAEAFSATDLVPCALPHAPDDVVEMAGYPERRAWAIVTLRAAVKEHLYREREAPLDSDSADSEPEPDTTERVKSFPMTLAHG